MAVGVSNTSIMKNLANANIFSIHHHTLHAYTWGLDGSEVANKHGDNYIKEIVLKTEKLRTASLIFNATFSREHLTT
ncbi:unnamed protein product [Sphenostylis stenocarpa]|uniref:Uncharacterized protein n=1 Tax=Sphenostylis stenocarpa TaxID=92480 RepID=A0AA86TCB5_9FABA|nr:unnamed protein product [Sphenostylis stenocarpa]